MSDQSIAVLHPKLVADSIRYGLSDLGITKANVEEELKRLIGERVDKLENDHAFSKLMDRSIENLVYKSCGPGGMAGLIKAEVTKQVGVVVQAQVAAMVKQACAQYGRS